MHHASSSCAIRTCCLQTQICLSSVPPPPGHATLSASPAYLLLNLAPEGAQGLLENFVLGLQAHTSLQVEDGLVEAAQLLQGLAPPVQCFDVPTVPFDG